MFWNYKKEIIELKKDIIAVENLSKRRSSQLTSRINGLVRINETQSMQIKELIKKVKIIEKLK